jgi:hypothetical protein
MSQVTLQGNASGTGIFTLAAPNSNTNRTLNLPDAAGDVVLTTATQTLTNKSISAAQINSGTLGVARGGTGASTLTANNVLLGNGTSALQAVAPGTSGNVLTSNGTTWTSAAPAAAAPVVDTFNSNGTWTKPSTGTMARIQVWGGGGGGARNSSTNSANGGGGGAYKEITVPLSSLAATVAVTVGSGGTGRTGSTGVGTAGGNSSFGSLLTAFGGLGGGTTTAKTYGGGVIGAGGTPEPNNLWLGGGQIVVNALDSNDNPVGTHVLSAVFGGGCGSSAPAISILGPGGTSVFAGDGGSSDRTGSPGVAPAGGGGGSNNNVNGANGAAGRVIVTVW